MLKVRITKSIISNDNEFKIGDDIFFHLCRNKKEYNCFGHINDINDKSFTISNVAIDGMAVLNVLKIKYEEVKDGIIKYEDKSWY